MVRVYFVIKIQYESDYQKGLIITACRSKKTSSMTSDLRISALFDGEAANQDGLIFFTYLVHTVYVIVNYVMSHKIVT